MSTPPPYHSYLLRLWQIKTDGEGWRVRLTQVDSGEERLFTDLETLFIFLRDTAHSNPELGPTSPDQSLPHELAWRQPSKGEKPMWLHKTTARVALSNKDILAEILSTDELLEMFRTQPGFRAYYLAENLTDPNEMASITLWDSQEDGETFYASPAYRQILAGGVPLLAGKPVMEFFRVKTELEALVPALN